LTARGRPSPPRGFQPVGRAPGHARHRR